MIGPIARAASFLGGLAALAIALAITFDVCMRYFFNRPQLGVDEISGFLQVLLVFWGAAYTFRQGGHIRVDLVTSYLPGPLRAWLRAVTLVVGIALLAIVAWVTLDSGLTAWRYQRVSAVMLYPIWPAMMLIPSGIVLLAIVMLVRLVRQVQRLRGPREGCDEVPPADRT